GLGLVFAQEVAAAVFTWDSSTAYNHCWLVLPVAIWLGWTRRAALSELAPRPVPWLGLLALGGAAAWLVAERLGIMEGGQLVVIGMVWVLALAVFGWRIGWEMAGPLAYLIFLVPFGEFLTPALQDLTLWMIELGLRALGITHYVDGLVIELPTGTYLVAEACAGLRFIIASVAFGALYALVMFRTPGRRLLVMVLSVVVPVVANGIRALGIVLLGHHLGSAEAGAADHLIYGWVFFSVVIVLLVLIGLPFRQDLAATVPVPGDGGPRAPAGRIVLAAAVAVLAGSGGRLAAARIEAGQTALVIEAARLTPPPGCTQAEDGAALLCAGAHVSARLVVFASGANWASVSAERRRAVGAEDDQAVVFNVTGPGMQWQARQGHEARNVVGVAAWLDGAPAGDGLRSRARQAWNGLRGAGGVPVLAVVELRPLAPVPGGERRLLTSILEAQAGTLASVAAGRSRLP
ncbi:MAG TPA: exosortase A, partial [Roseococcus sp.]|nr:exosortase A [Roseococcus sp.]